MTQKRDQQISTYLTEEEKQNIRELSAKEGYSGISGWLRDLALEELEEAQDEGNPNGHPMATAD